MYRYVLLGSFSHFPTELPSIHTVCITRQMVISWNISAKIEEGKSKWVKGAYNVWDQKKKLEEKT